MRLIGHYLDRDIIFDLVEEKAGTWTFQTRIPAISSGYIILELYAIDDAGNIGTSRESIVLIDFNNLTIEVLWNKMSATKVDSGIHAKELFEGTFFATAFSADVYADKVAEQFCSEPHDSGAVTEVLQTELHGNKLTDDIHAVPYTDGDTVSEQSNYTTTQFSTDYKVVVME
jgi:hypothetical protein